MLYEMAEEAGLIRNLRTILQDTPDLVAVYLFGSTARQQTHALSDLDLAVLFEPGLTEEALFDRTLELGAILEDSLRQSVDLVALNRAPPALCFQVLKDGRLVVERDRTQRCLFVVRALNRYYDAKSYLDYHNAQLVSRIREEGLGRGYRGHRDALAEARRLSTHFAPDADSFPG